MLSNAKDEAAVLYVRCILLFHKCIHIEVMVLPSTMGTWYLIAVYTRRQKSRKKAGPP